MEKSEKIMSLAEVAEYLMLSERTLYRMVNAKEIPAIKVKRRWRFKKSLIDDWLDGFAIKEEGGDENGEEKKIAWLTESVLRCPLYPDDE